MEGAVLLVCLAVAVAVTPVAHAQSKAQQCKWMDQPVAKDNELVMQTVNLAVNRLQQQVRSSISYDTGRTRVIQPTRIAMHEGHIHR
jgi:hypothetical protein